MYCQVPCLSTSILFSTKSYVMQLSESANFSNVFFNVTNLCFDCPLLNIECVLFSYTVSGKDLSKHITLIWILIERPYKLRHKFQVDLTAFKARNPVLAVKWRANSARWTLVWNKILYSLLENNRFVLSSTLTCGYAIAYFQFLKKISSQFKETVIFVQIALTVLTSYLLTAERNYHFRLYITDFCHNPVLSVI